MRFSLIEQTMDECIIIITTSLFLLRKKKKMHEELLQKVKAEIETAHNKRTFFQLHEHKPHENANQSQGYQRYALLQQHLTNVPGFKRHEMQIMFHDVWVRSIFPHIFGSEWVMRSHEILKEFNLQPSEVNKETMAITPRQMGKTQAVCMLIQAAMIALPGFRTLVIAAQGGQTTIISDRVFAMLRSKGLERRIVRYDDAMMCVANRDLPIGCSMRSDMAHQMVKEATTSTLRLIAGGQTGIAPRGHTADLIVIDEASSVHNRTLEAVIPMLSRENTILIAISSPKDINNYYSRLFELKDKTGKPLLNVMKIQTVCDPCKAAKIELPSGICKHANLRLPPWRRLEDQTRVIRMGSTEWAQQELMGLVTGAETPMFYKFVNELREQKRIPLEDCYGSQNWQRAGGVAYMGVDPARGGVCHFGFATFVIVQNKLVVRMGWIERDREWDRKTFKIATSWHLAQ